MIIFEPVRAIFVHVPRTGGNSMRVWFQAGGIKDAMRGALLHPPVRLYKRFLGAWFYDSTYRFAVVRNPWERMVSLYELMRQPTTPGTIGDVTFDEFVRQRAEGVEFMLQGFDGEDCLDYVARFEDFPASLLPIAQKFNLQVENFPHCHPGAHDHYSVYYTHETAGIVARKCQWEIEKFGYRFELKPS